MQEDKVDKGVLARPYYQPVAPHVKLLAKDKYGAEAELTAGEESPHGLRRIPPARDRRHRAPYSWFLFPQDADFTDQAIKGTSKFAPLKVPVGKYDLYWFATDEHAPLVLARGLEIGDQKRVTWELDTGIRLERGKGILAHLSSGWWGVTLPGQAGSTTASYDWDQVFADNNTAPPSFSGALTSAFVTDPVNSTLDDVFTGGGSKDTLGIQEGPWLFTSTKPQAKNDISHAYAAIYTDPSNGHRIAYAGMARFDNSGDATAGFWFFRNPIGENSGVLTNGGHPFTGTHTEGDILLVSDFTVGGSISAIRVFRWTGDDSTGSLVALNNGSPINGDTLVIVNSAAVAVPWSFTDKSHNTSPVAGEFLEAGVDLTAVGLDNSFPSFLAEIRSSLSPTATLSDFVIGNFSQASGSVAATPFVGLSAVGQSVTYPLTVTNTGAVTLYLQDVSDPLLGNIVVAGVVQVPVAPVTNIDASGLSADGSLAPGATVTIFVTRTVQATDPDPTLNTVTFVFNARPDFGGSEITTSVTDRVDLATFSGFLDFLTSTGGAATRELPMRWQRKSQMRWPFMTPAIIVRQRASSAHLSIRSKPNGESLSR